jgi:hypothetical protein
MKKITAWVSKDWKGYRVSLDEPERITYNDYGDEQLDTHLDWNVIVEHLMPEFFEPLFDIRLEDCEVMEVELTLTITGNPMPAKRDD